MWVRRIWAVKSHFIWLGRLSQQDMQILIGDVKEFVNGT